MVLGAVLAMIVLVVVVGLPGLVRAIGVRFRLLRRQAVRRARPVRYRAIHGLAWRPAGRQGRFGRHG
jgi:hypothetical protein